LETELALENNVQHPVVLTGISVVDKILRRNQFRTHPSDNKNIITHCKTVKPSVEKTVNNEENHLHT